VTTKRPSRKQWDQRILKEAVRRYGRGCYCCDEKSIEFLLIVPSNDAGRKLAKGVKDSLPYWLKRQGFPSGFRVYCANCHRAMKLYGYCPHTEATL
jgi:hypothetical protein